MKVYEVGGSIRDSFLGIKNNDIDAAVECDSFEELCDWVASTHKQVFLITPEHLTVRAIDNNNTVRDYVMCRVEGPYSDGRRPDWVKPGTIFDDLARRDFTVNAIARSIPDGTILDPHGGQKDLQDRVLRCVGEPIDRFTEDGLRIIRALRFAITKQLVIANKEWEIIRSQHASTLLDGVSAERIRAELAKCFKHDTIRSMEAFTCLHPTTQKRIFNDSDIWLLPTQKAR